MIRLLLLFLVLSGTVFSQRQAQLIDALTGEPVPFSKVIPTPGSPFLADIDGFFTIPEGATEIQFKAQGYYDSIFAVANIGTQVVLRAEASDLEEVTIVPGVNPAERIMELAIANRKKNHPMGDESFTYTSYSKFVFTMDQDALAKIPEDTPDSNLRDLRKFFNEQHLFMMESTTQKYFEPPYREKEVITAYKVSGFSDPAFSTFSNELQSFNFYENQFNILGKTYINPLAFGSIRRYLFILEDQTVVNGDTTFTIRFQPRKDKNFEGMKGWLYINSNGYALEKVIAEPAEKSESIDPKIIQEYALIDGKRWFPVKLSTEAIFPALRLDDKLENGYLVGKGSTYIEQVVIGADLSKQRFNAVTIQTAEDANEKDSIHWNAERKFELTDKEERTYVMVDSISKVYKLDQRLSSLGTLAEGKIPLGYVQLDLLRLVDYREYEGYRFGLGLENSKKLMKRVTVGGYFGYGTRDKDWKYGGYAKWMVFPKQFVQLQASFQEDLVERGGTNFLSAERGLALNSFSRHLYVKNMEKQRKAEVALSAYVTPRIKVLASANYQRIGLTDGYEFHPESGTVLAPDRTFDVAEASLEAIWTIREKVMYLGTKRVSKGTQFPRISVKAAKGISGIEAAALDYLRLNIDIQQDVPIRAVGKFSYLISAGKTTGNVPLFLQQMNLGTGGNWNLSVINSFETMKPSMFYSKEHVSIFTRFTFKPIKTGKKWTSPQFGIHHAMGTGSFDRKEEHQIAGFVNETPGLVQLPFYSMDKGYYEVGIIADKLINLNTTGFGLGIFYNYGAYSVPQFDKNLTVKVSLSFVL
jgi:Family of unknown function (DUF5686)